MSNDMVKLGKKARNTIKYIAVILVISIIFVMVLLIQHNVMNKNMQEELQKVKDEAKGSITVPVSDNIRVDKNIIMQVISPAAELTTCKFFYTDADVYIKSKPFFNFGAIPFTTDQTVFTYSGELHAGIDFNNISIDVKDNEQGGQDILITLPEPKIIYNKINHDKFQAYDVKNSIFTTTSLNEYSEMAAALEKKQEEKLMENEEFWKEAKDSAQNTISSLISAIQDTEKLNITFNWTSNK